MDGTDADLNTGSAAQALRVEGALGRPKPLNRLLFGKTVVTGGFGRIGSALVSRLAQRGEHVIVLDRCEPKGPLPKDVTYHVTDMSNPSELAKLLRDVETVYHLAATIDYKASRDSLFRSNILPAINLSHAAKGCAVRQLIFMSSTSVYGEVQRGGQPLTEESPCAPLSNYGWSKLECEKVIRQGLQRCTILRSSQVFGPQFTEGYVDVLRKVKDGSMRIIGDGSNIVPLIHIDDLVNAMLFVRGKRSALSQVFNVDGGYHMSQYGFMKQAAMILGVPTPKKVSPFMARLSLKLGGKEKEARVQEYLDKLARNRPISIQKIKALGWRPGVQLEPAMRQTIEAFKTAGLL